MAETFVEVTGYVSPIFRLEDSSGMFGETLEWRGVKIELEDIER